MLLPAWWIKLLLPANYVYLANSYLPSLCVCSVMSNPLLSQEYCSALSFPTSDLPHTKIDSWASCIGKQILSHSTTWKSICLLLSTKTTLSLKNHPSAFTILIELFISHIWHLSQLQGFPGGSDSEESVCNAGDPSSIPGLGKSPWKGNGYPHQYSCLENPMERGAW